MAANLSPTLKCFFPRFTSSFMLCCAALLLLSCGKEIAVKPGEPCCEGRMVLETGAGFFVSADNKKGEGLIADRHIAGREELLKAAYRPDSMLHLRTPQGIPVIPDPVTGILRPARNAVENALGAAYRMEARDGARGALRHPAAGYVAVGPGGVLTSGAERLAAEPFKIIEKPRLDFDSLSASDKLPLNAGLIFLAAGLLIFFLRNKSYAALAALFAGAFLLRYFVAMLPPGLHVWDEQYHALVAKNMMDNPFRPMLIKKILYPYPIEVWDMGQVWLHKQPLFLWQIAASFKAIGISTFALRLPSMLMSAAICLFIYRIGARIVNPRAGYLGAFFFACSYYFLELGAGAFHTDHNDVAFLFYVSASVSAWIEYEKSIGRRRLIFLLLLGLSAGAAVLVKWLPGILVFSGWGISILSDSTRRRNLRLYFEALFAAAAALSVFLPWQFFVLNEFPEVSRYEFGLNTSHFYEALEEHDGGWMFHLDAMSEIYGVPYYVVIPCVALLIFRIRERMFRIAVSVFIAAVYVFFTVAATKMIGFTAVVSFLIFLSFGAVADGFIQFIGNQIRPYKFSKVWLSVTLVIVFATGLSGFRTEDLEKNHLDWQSEGYGYLNVREHNIKLLRHTDVLLPDDRPVAFFNCFDYDHIAVLFFTKAATAYCRIPDSSMIETLKGEGIHIVVSDNGKLPDYILNDPEIQIVKGFKFW